MPPLVLKKAGVIAPQKSSDASCDPSFSIALFTNCFDFATDNPPYYAQGRQLHPMRPEDLGWLDLKTKEEWKREVTEHFSPVAPPGDALSERIFGNHPFEYPWRWVICFPYIEGARDYHWAALLRHSTKLYIVEQAGMGGDVLAWDNEQEFLNNVYQRRDKHGNLYVPGSHFVFKCRIN